MEKSTPMAAMGGSYLGGLEGNSTTFKPDHLQTTLFSCSQSGGEVEKVSEERTIQALLPALVEESLQRGMQTFMPHLVQEAVLKGIQDLIPTLVEAEVHKGMQAMMPVMVEKMKKMMMDAFLPLMQPSNLPSSSGSLVHMKDSPKTRTLQLHFECQGKSGERIYAGEKLKEQGILFKVVLKDDSGNIVEVVPESSAKIQIVVLHSNIPVEDTDDMASKIFQNPVEQREDKPSLIVGACVKLAKGVADLDDIMFTDNSSWVSSKKFRLGATIVKGVPHGVTIKNAISKAFRVLECRGKCYQKIENPALNDKVWRLHHIAKDGPIHKRLEDANISTVNDLRLKNISDPESLKKILKVSKKKFEDIVNQATSSDYGGKDAMPSVDGAPNEMYQICETNYQASYPTPNTFPATGSSTQLPFDVAAPILGAEMQLSYKNFPQPLIHKFPGFPAHNAFPASSSPTQIPLSVAGPILGAEIQQSHNNFLETVMASQSEQLIPGFPTPNTFPVTGSSTQLPLDVAPIPGVETQLSHNNFPGTEMISQPEMIDMIPGFLEDVNWPADNYYRVQEIENQFQACTRNTQTPKRGLHKPRWRSVGVALRFSVFRMVIIRQAGRAQKKQRLN